MKEVCFTYKYPRAALTTDCVVFGFDGKSLYILLIERANEPYKGSWALPGGFLHMDETVEECAKRELEEETNVKNIYIEEFHSFSDINRDPRERVVTIAFFALVRKDDYRVIGGDDAAIAVWFNIDDLPDLAFDHTKIVIKAKEKIQEKLRIEPIAFRLLNKQFSMTELQNLYESINGIKYDRRNFSKKMLATGFIEDKGISGPTAYYNMPHVYEFNEDAYCEYLNNGTKRKYPFDF